MRRHHADKPAADNETFSLSLIESHTGYVQLISGLLQVKQ